MKDNNTKTKAKKLTDATVRSLKRQDKTTIHSGDYPGLYLWVLVSGSKSWYYQQRIKGKKYPYRKNLGQYPTVGVQEAINRAKIISQQIYNGTDPREQLKSEVLKMQLGEAIKKYYEDELTTANQYRPSTIKGVKAIFKPWIFRNTYEKDILNRLERVEDIQYKKLSSITPKKVAELHKIVGARSPYVANRLIEYLRLFWNSYIKTEDNPFIHIKKRDKFEETEYLDFLSKEELTRVMGNAVKEDNRSGRLLASHYKDNSLNPVSCLAVAFCLATARRNLSEASSLKWENYKQGEKPRIELKQTKTSKKNKVVSFRLGDEAISLLKLISTDRLNNPDSAFYYPLNDMRNKYIFPSKDYGRKLKDNQKGKTPHLVNPFKTWDRLLKMSGITRHMKLYATRHTFATAFYDATKDIKAGAEALGVTEKTFLKYAKLMDNTVVEGTNKIKFFKDETPTLVEVPKIAKVIE